MKKLLIVDDQKEYLNSLAVALKKRFEIILATDYQSAMEKLQNDVDLALIDIRLDQNDEKNVDGLKILEWIIKNKPSISPFLMSAYKDFSYESEAIKLGAKHFFKKPVDILNLIEVLQEKG